MREKDIQRLEKLKARLKDFENKCNVEAGPTDQIATQYEANMAAGEAKLHRLQAEKEHAREECLRKKVKIIVKIAVLVKKLDLNKEPN